MFGLSPFKTLLSKLCATDCAAIWPISSQLLSGGFSASIWRAGCRCGGPRAWRVEAVTVNEWKWTEAWCGVRPYSSVRYLTVTYFTSPIFRLHTREIISLITGHTYPLSIKVANLDVQKVVHIGDNIVIAVKITSAQLFSPRYLQTTLVDKSPAQRVICLFNFSVNKVVPKLLLLGPPWSSRTPP